MYTVEIDTDQLKVMRARISGDSTVLGLTNLIEPGTNYICQSGHVVGTNERAVVIRKLVA